MHLRIFLFSSLLFQFALSSNAQDFNNYQPLKSSGKLPDDFVTLSSESYKQETQKIESNTKRSVKKAKERFYLENSFRIRELLYGGKVLFNDPVTVYLNKIADELLKNDPALRKKIRIYAVKTPYVNAFATNAGIILINLGLISQLENEAQLAFVLAHEIIHYKNGHVLDNYLENEKIDNGRGAYKRRSSEDKFLAKSNFSKEKESEADLEGIEIFLKSNYSTQGLIGVFNVLEYAHLPYDDQVFEKKYFESKELVFPTEYFLETTKEITEPEDDDTKSTHPSIKKRRQYIKDKIANVNNTGKKSYIISEGDFLNIRKISRFEISHLYLQSLEYEKAIYNSYLLLKEFPDNLYLKKIIGKSLYAMAKYSNKDRFKKAHEDYEPIEGSSQQLVYFFEKLNRSELSVLSLKYLWALKKQYPKDTEIESLTLDIFKETVFEHFDNKEMFSKVGKQEMTNSLATMKDTVKVAKLTKYDKIKLKQEEQKTVDDKKFITFAFVDELKDAEFVNLFDKYSKEKNAESKKAEETKKERKARLAKKRKEERLIAKQGQALGIDKIVVFNPFYLKLDHRKKQSRKYIQSEEAQIDFNDKIGENCSKAGLDYELIDDVAFKDNDIQKFNDLAFLNNWFFERLEHVDNSVNVLNLDKDQVSAIVKKYNTKYFCWIGLVNERNIKHNKGLAIFVSVLYFPLLPWGLSYVLTPDWDTNFYSVVLNIETGEVCYNQISAIDAKDANYILNSTLYDLFYQIKNKRK